MNDQEKRKCVEKARLELLEKNVNDLKEQRMQILQEFERVGFPRDQAIKEFNCIFQDALKKMLKEFCLQFDK